MIIRKSEVYSLAVGPEGYPKDGLPEIAFVGRSNVGKSSLINTLVSRKNLARTSSTPGKTQTINFYNVNDALFLVDLPGYGYAKASKADRTRWGKFIEAYLSKREELVGIIQLIDLRHPPMDSDQIMAEWMEHHGIKVHVVGTKADKLSKGQWAGQIKLAREKLSLPEGSLVTAFSAVTGQGKESIWAWIEDRMTASVVT